MIEKIQHSLLHAAMFCVLNVQMRSRVDAKNATCAVSHFLVTWFVSEYLLDIAFNWEGLRIILCNWSLYT